MEHKDQAAPVPERRAEDRRNGERRSSLRACAGRRRADRRRTAVRAGLAMAALSLLPSLRGHASSPRAQLTQEARQEPQAASEGKGGPFDKFIEEAAALYGVSEDLVRAVIQTESRFDPAAKSPVGALGLMQLMPRTARYLGIDDPMDPKQNIFGGVKYLAELLERHNGNVALALASYNAGPTVVRRHRGVPPIRETRGYVRKIQGLLVDALPNSADEAPGD